MVIIIYFKKMIVIKTNTNDAMRVTMKKTSKVEMQLAMSSHEFLD
jgi:hypothetical protein